MGKGKNTTTKVVLAATVEQEDDGIPINPEEEEDVEYDETVNGGGEAGQNGKQQII